MILSLAHLHRRRDIRSVCDSFAFLVTALMNRVRVRLSDIALSIRQRIEHNSASCVHLRLKNLSILVLQLELKPVFIRQFTAAHRLRDLKNRLAFRRIRVDKFRLICGSFLSFLAVNRRCRQRSLSIVGWRYRHGVHRLIIGEMTVRILRLHLADGIRVRLPCIIQSVRDAVLFRLPFCMERYISCCVVRSGCYDRISLLQNKAELSGFQSCPCKSLMRMERCTSSRRVRVRDVVTLDLRRVICDLILRYRIRDLFPICILRQIRERILPLICRCNGLAFFHLSIRKKVHRDRIRSLSILIVCIIPRLCSADLSCLRFFILNRQLIAIIIDIV